MAKKDGRHRTASAQATVREQVVRFLKRGNTQKQAMEIFGLSQSGVEKIWRRYKLGGNAGIKEKKRGVQGGGKINGKQSAQIRGIIKDKMPDQLKLPLGLWTREVVQQLIASKFGIELSRWQVARYLNSWGYTPRNRSVKPLSKSRSK
jgi:transposase